jgi:hypothetical protein
MAGMKAVRLEPATTLRQLELRRLDKLSLALWSLATAKPPDYAAIDRLIKIMQRRAALAGLDVSKVALTNPTGKKEFSGKIIKVNWEDLYKLQAERAAERFDPIEERIKQVAATTANALPNQAVSPGGQNGRPERLPPGKNGDHHA